MIFPKFKDCQLCRLCSHRTQIVWGTGNEKADLFLVGEAPGETEDSTGLPFQGKAGQKLDRILNYVGLDRSKVYISNSLLCRPPNNMIRRMVSNNIVIDFVYNSSLVWFIRKQIRDSLNLFLA